jgi:hypothetical protein
MRRTVAALLGLVLLAGCDPADPGGHAPLTWPPGLVVASYRIFGGLAPASWGIFDEPDVVVYSDGLTVAAANLQLRLTPDEVSEVVRGLRGELSGLGPVASPSPPVLIMDAPSTTFQVREDGGNLYSVSANALTESGGFDPRLIAAKRRMEALRDRIERNGLPYVSDRVRVIAAQREQAGPTKPWPEGVPLPPPPSAEAGVRVGVLTGDDAATLVATLGPSPRTGNFPLLRTEDGTVYAVGWRYLLPDE